MSEVRPQSGNPAPGAPSDTRADAPVSGGARVFAPDFLTELFRNPLDAGYADAAKRKAAKGDGSVNSRRTGFAVRMIALVATGLLLAVAYQQTVAAKPESTKVRDGLISDVQQRQRDTEALQRQADSLRTQVSQLRDSLLASSGAQGLRNLEAAVGGGAVKGDGAVVTLSDGPVPTDPVTGKPDTNPDHYLGRVLDTDLQVIANELWRDGAEAIAVNGQRLTATSTIRTAGSAILVDFTPLNQPYQVVAVGPSDLADRFNRSATAAESQRLRDTYGMHVAVAQRSNLTAPAAADADLRYASPVPAPGSPSPGTSGSPPASKTTTPHPNPTSTGGR